MMVLKNGGKLMDRLNVNLKVFLESLIAGMSLVAAIITIISYFTIYKFYEIGVSGLVIIIEGLVIMSMLFTFINEAFHKENCDESECISLDEKNMSEQRFAQTLKDKLDSYIEKKDYPNAMRFGHSISNVLWLNGQYELRVQMGEMVEETAARTDSYFFDASALIDDIGWTLVPLRKYDDASQNILKGIKVAEKINDYKLISKGYRHLSGISLQNKNTELAKEYIEKSMEMAEKIKDEHEKLMMKAGITYNLAEYYFVSESFDEAKEKSEESKIMFEKHNDTDRSVKYYSQMGKIELTLNNISEAKNLFLKGLDASMRVNRNDEIVKNNMGLSICYSRMGDNKRAKEHLNQIKVNGKGVDPVYSDDLKYEMMKINL
jgi:tetratricopeptide (TPR) repeat protein